MYYVAYVTKNNYGKYISSQKQILTKQKTDKIGQGKKFYIETLGCQMNVADSELIIAMLNDEGFVKSNSPQNSDLIFINTCSIREKSRRKSSFTIRKVG